MLKVYYKGKMRRILGIQVGDRQVSAWYDVNKRKIWPDDSARSNALRVKLPEKGTEAWAYWVHAVDALRNLGAADDCNLYVEINKKKYYLIASPDGSEPLQLEGNALYFTGDGAFPTEGIGASVTVHGVVPARCGGKRWTDWDADKADNCEYKHVSNGSEKDFDKEVTNPPEWFDWWIRHDKPVIYSAWNALLPILPMTYFRAILSKTQREQPVRVLYRVSGLASEDVYCERKAYRIGNRGEHDVSSDLKEASYDESSNVWVNNGNVYHAPDTGFKLEMWTGSTGSSMKSGVCVVHPQISKMWELEVVSVNEISL